MTNDEADLLALYKEYKLYIQHEDNVANQRVTWLIAVSALSVSFEFSLVGLYVLNRINQGLDILPIGLRLVSALLSVTAFGNLLIACAAVAALNGAAGAAGGAYNLFYKYVGNDDKYSKDARATAYRAAWAKMLPLPQLTHGVDEKAIRLPRLLYPRSIAAMIAAGWFTVLMLGLSFVWRVFNLAELFK